VVTAYIGGVFMAVKKFRFRPEGFNDYSDILHPETSADIVLLKDTAGNFSSNNVEGALAELKGDLNAHLADNTPNPRGNKIYHVEVVSSSGSVTPEQGRIIFDTSKKKFFGGTGSGWV